MNLKLLEVKHGSKRSIKEALIQLIRETVQEGGSIFVGKENVLSKLQNAKEKMNYFSTGFI